MKTSLFLSLLLIARAVYGQDTVSYSGVVADFLQPDVNVIHNSVALSHFYDKLYQLKKTRQGTVNILHIGDSHIQADFLTQAARTQFQQEFGNAGRGFVFPGRVGRTNEAPSIYSSSKAAWDSKRIIYTQEPTPIGLGAMTITTLQAQANLLIRTHPVDNLTYSFNRITLLYQKDEASFHLALKDSTGAELAYAGAYTVEEDNVSRIVLSCALNQIELVTLQSQETQTRFSLYGLVLENGEPGILYHATGGNGAKVKHYLDAALFADQSKVIQPDLIIISLGTNEAIEHPYVDPQVAHYLDQLITQLSPANPQAQILLTTPMDFYKKKTRRNPGVEQVRNAIVGYADSHNRPYWDLFTVGGGKNSADLWKKNGLLQPDGIHFTKAGYHLQGQLLYEALIKGYHEYVQFRYP